jgi:hypothetical protein
MPAQRKGGGKPRCSASVTPPFDMALVVPESTLTYRAQKVKILALSSSETAAD